MKTKILTILVLFAAMLTACKDDPAYDGERAASELSFTVVDCGYTPSDNNKKSVTERSATERNHKRTFIEGDKIGLYAVKGDAVVADVNNLCLTLTDIGGGVLEWKTPSNVPISKHADRFFIYYPYQETLAGVVDPTATDADTFFANMIASWTPVRDQSDYAKGYSASDLMVGKGTPGTTVDSNGKCPLEITLDHKMGLATFSIPPDATELEFKSFKPCYFDGVYYYLVKPAIKTILEGVFKHRDQEQEYNIDATVGAGTYSAYNFNFDFDGDLIKMSFTIDLTGYNGYNDRSYTIPLIPWEEDSMLGCFLSIDWGNGKSRIVEPDRLLSIPITQYYEKSKQQIFTITIYMLGVLSNKLEFGSSTFNYDNALKLISMDSQMLYTGYDYSECFKGCKNLKTISSDLFYRNPYASDFSNCFSGCTSLTEIPAGLFDRSRYASDFSNCFYDCSAIKKIPAGLFANNSEVTSFDGCFSGCISLTEAPAGLFANCPAVTTFRNCFYNCNSLKEVPTNLFGDKPKATDFAQCFYGCSCLTKIPEGLFANCPAVKDFSYCFRGCSSLSTLPSDLFANNPAVVHIYQCFQRCSALTTIPANLFGDKPNITSFSQCFEGCEKLTRVPKGLFAKCPAVTSFYGCFANCTALHEVFVDLFSKNPAVVSFEKCFKNCKYLAALPPHMFANNLAATNFEECLYKCTAILLNHDIFCNDEATEKDKRFAGKAMNFQNCFYECSTTIYGGHGEAPALWSYPMKSSIHSRCFYGVTNVENVADIPAGWK